ncbi:MAG: reverse transcriptase domain-containing protein, partial [Holophagaceae bacterium]
CERFGTAKGHIFGTTIVPLSATALVTGIKTTKSHAEAHQILGHPGKELMKSTSNRLGWNLTGEDIPCEDCMIAKARRSNVNKVAKNPSTTPGERLMIDISSVKTTDNKKSGRFWLLVVDEATDMKWSFFLQSKSQQVPVLQSHIKILKEIGHPVKYIRCDNAGENESLKKQLEQEGSPIRFEFTARQTPQQNGKVERAFASLYGRMRAMMRGAGFDDSSKMKLWMEAASTATKLDNILSLPSAISPYKKFYGADAKYQDYLRTFGEIGIVTKNPGGTIKAKLEDRGERCMFLGYAANHAPNVYRMWNIRTNKVWITRDIKWANKMPDNAPKQGDDDGDDDDPSINTVGPNPNPVPVVQPVAAPAQPVAAPTQPAIVTPMVTRAAPRLSRELKALQNFNEPGRLELEGQDNHFCFFVPDTSSEEPYEPTTFEEAWNHPDPTERHFWREAIRLEFRQMIKNKVWRKEGIQTLPLNRKGIGTKWVFKKKKNGVYRARLVVKGYDQVAGIDFQYNFAPVTSEVTLRILMILWISEDYFAEVADVQTAFLHGELEEELFIKIPSGYKEFLSEEGTSIYDPYLQLTKSTYGLVQAARSWWQKFTGVLKRELNFEQHASDSCLLKRFDENGKVFLIIYVDDCFVVGDRKAVKKALDDIQGVFNITRSENVEDFIGCTIKRTGNKVLLSQPDLIKKMLEKFEEKIARLKGYETPASASSHVNRCIDEEDGLNDEDQQEFRSGVGSLLYLLKHSRPDLSNSVRELSKVMDRANKAHEKMLHRVIRFVEETKNRCLVLSPMKENITWDLKGYCDSDFAGDSDTRKSVSGFVIYLCGAAISWRSKGQKSVTLSSTEAEYVAISEVATEILYIAGILKFLNIPLAYPIQVNVDNIGAIYLTKNATTGSRTKHVDTRYHFVREYVEDGIVKVQFVRSEDNHADIFTKNLNGELFD